MLKQHSSVLGIRGCMLALAMVSCLGSAARDAGRSSRNTAAPGSAAATAPTVAKGAPLFAEQPPKAEAACSGQTLGRTPPAVVPATALRPALVPIPAGGFSQGEGADPESMKADPAHRVCITHGFLMMETEVTLGQYFQVVEGFAADQADMLAGEERRPSHVLPCVRIPRTAESPMSEVGFFGVLN